MITADVCLGECLAGKEPGRFSVSVGGSRVVFRYLWTIESERI